jgi:succinate-acetate transporter protein
MALIFDGFGSRSLSLLLIIFGLFYGVFGVFRLKVLIDLFLLFGTLMLLIRYLSVRTITQKS